ncbi:MAG: protein kinase domain-containing protein [Candidatus Acidiferrales bacterium]
MAIQPFDKLVLPELAAALGASGPEFRVEAVFPGGMGICCKIVHIKSGEPYALKMMRAGVSLNEIGYRRFLEELKLWSAASACDGVVEAYSIFRINEVPCVCARWMPGGDLSPHLAERSPAFFYRTMDRVIGILDWVFGEYKIIHRDLKPSNILFDEEARPFISDWGIAKVQGQTAIPPQRQSKSTSKSHLDLTQTGQFIGTIPYSSPEQILGAREIDHRADIYSLGCLMFEWETGSVPFYGASPEEIAYKHLEVAAPKLGGLFKRTTFGAEKVIARCLEKKPTNRFQEYSELRRELGKAARSRGISLEGNYEARRRYSLPLVGAGEIDKRGFPNAVIGKGDYAAVETDELMPYLKEAEVLSGVGEWQKAAAILERAFVPGMFQEFPDSPVHQLIAANLGRCLVNLGRTDEALKALRTVNEAKRKVPEYFLNLSAALLGRNASEAETVARQGLKEYPGECGILGNLTLALLEQSKLTEARANAEARLKISEDVHSLDEMAVVLLRIGNLTRDTDYPSAAKSYSNALSCLRHAKSLNARYLGARFNLAKVWFELEEYARSAQELNDLARSNLPSVYLEMWAVQKGQCMDRTALFDECREFCDAWLGKMSNSIALRRIRAECMTDYFIGKEKDGVRLVERGALEFFTDVAERPEQLKASDLIYMARIKEWIGALDEAFSLFDRAESLEPNNWEGPYCRALALWRLKDFQLAFSYAKKACVLGPWTSKTWEGLSMIQKSNGALKEAQEYEHKAHAIAEKRGEIRRLVASRYDQGC